MAGFWANPAFAVEDGKICTSAIESVEKNSSIPANILHAISRVESGRADPISKKFTSWPWTVNANGKGYFLNTKDQAIQLVKSLQASGIKSIDVGCMQINLWHHKKAFRNLDEAFEPTTNVAYAVKFLQNLYDDGQSWFKAIGNYHSASPEFHERYKKKVLANLDSLNKGRTYTQEIRSTTPSQVAVNSTPSTTNSNTVTKPKASIKTASTAKYTTTVRYTKMTIFEADAARKAAVLAAWEARKHRQTPVRQYASR
jgi:nuclear transport factor 2 (NTF2) superfamily protein